jgi:hypothetical protein
MTDATLRHRVVGMDKRFLGIANVTVYIVHAIYSIINVVSGSAQLSHAEGSRDRE